MNLSQTIEDHENNQPFVAHLNIDTDPSVNIALAAAGSLIMVTLELLQQLISHLSPALVLHLSIRPETFSYLVFIWLTQKEEIKENRRLLKGGRGL
ncbi:MAG: hypothetical protein SCH39_04750 [Methanosarcinales archaeon]|nr:hypothetical protein [Methanosarcinales archaeon]